MNELARVAIGSPEEALERIRQAVSAFVEQGGPDLERDSLELATRWGLLSEQIKEIWADARKSREAATTAKAESLFF
jgi:hypothetical protein